MYMKLNCLTRGSLFDPGFSSFWNLSGGLQVTWLSIVIRSEPGNQWLALDYSSLARTSVYFLTVVKKEE